jgi:hypothetical protein
MKPDEIRDEILTQINYSATQIKYLAKDTKKFLLQLAVWGVGFIIIGLLAIKEFCEKRLKSIRKRISKKQAGL